MFLPFRQRCEQPGFGQWSQKQGIWYARPPDVLLETALAVRIDIDGSTVDNGALQVLTGTHRLGTLDAAAIAGAAATIEPVTCAVPAGGVLLMRPLLPHSSPRSRLPAHRRTIRIEYGNWQLAPELAMAHAVRAVR